jgi:hypothetical protein
MGVPFTVKHPQSVDKEKSYGETQGFERLIKIKDSLKGEVYEATLMHEIIHAILHTSGISEMLGEELEEAIVVSLEHGLIQIYKRKE